MLYALILGGVVWVLTWAAQSRTTSQRVQRPPIVPGIETFREGRKRVLTKLSWMRRRGRRKGRRRRRRRRKTN